MKIKLLLAISLLSLVSCGSRGVRTSFEEYNLKGDVLSIKQTTYEAESKFGEIVTGDIEYSGNALYEFKDKMISSKTEFDKRGAVEKKEISIYDESGKIIETSLYDSDGDLESKTIYEYSDNLPSSQSAYDSKGNVEMKIEFETDGQNIIKGKFIESKYNLGHWENRWDGDKLLQTVNYDNDGSVGSINSYTDSGRLSKIARSDMDILITHNEFDDVITSVNARTYDIYGFIIEAGQTYYYEYEYDSHNNWVKRVVLLGERKKPYQIVERVITYAN